MGLSLRIKIFLKSLSKEFAIPINYNYALSSALYRIFYESSPEFAQWLHNQGYVSKDGKRLKLFTFSRLFVRNARVVDNVIQGVDGCWFLFSSPFDATVVENLLVGVFKRSRIVIANRYAEGKFKISKIEQIVSPRFSNDMRYIMLSPTVASKVERFEGKLREHYYRADEAGVEKALEENLLRKFEIVYKREYTKELGIELDREYIETKGGAEAVSKMVVIAEGSYNETKVKSFLCPIRIVGDVEIQKVAYECGIGKKNGLGFGMLDVVDVGSD